MKRNAKDEKEGMCHVAHFHWNREHFPHIAKPSICPLPCSHFFCFKSASDQKLERESNPVGVIMLWEYQPVQSKMYRLIYLQKFNPLYKISVSKSSHWVG